MSLDVSMSAPSDVASIPPPPPPGIEAVSAATSFLDEQAVEHSEVVQKFAEKSSLEPEQAKATLEACIAPANLLAHESQVYGDGAGPLATALAARDNAIHAFSYASHVHHSADVLTNLSAQAHEADQTAKKGNVTLSRFASMNDG